ncbi:DUF1850 domain-containing protein [Natribacillus halophilus]|uniref:DUF1850 domain-containing protein n=1 Tax=Natribacillus halophilus TaxID=549003 RepID=A0A1G8MVH9_9BACI|nr:DUF1850 domain-containing protein [Natribacillus halophilus]SDI71340.1 hypothetical protein SAMN04488123_10517 [Natribacillus halophilus]
MRNIPGFLQGRWGVFLLFLAILLLLAVFWEQTPKLQVVATESDDVLFEEEIEPGDTFFHEYIHSVMKTPIREVFEINDDFEVVPKETWTQAFGAGIPYEANEPIRQENGFYVIPDDGRVVEELRLIPSNLYTHTFQFKNETLDLSDMEEDDRRIMIHVQGG